MKSEYKKEYIDLWKSCKINSVSFDNISKWVDNIIKNNRYYVVVGMSVDLPWYLIACIHSLESSLNFKTHLHNGDSLLYRTKHVPSGRPRVGEPPFTWQFSAGDALSEKIKGVWSNDLVGIRENRVESILYALESYNGLGYKKYHPDVKSPYLWSKTNIYTKGKYVEDGKFDIDAVSSQIGAVAILKMLELKKAINPLILPEDIDESIINNKSDKKTIAMLQVFMNSLPGEKIDEDGKIGPETKKRYKKVFGTDLT